MKHLIYLSACGDLMPGAIFHERFGGLVPGHVLVKMAVEQMLRGSKVWNEKEGGRTFTILGPTLFFSNDLRGKESMMGPGGIHGEPIGTRGVSRVDVEDIALAVVKVAKEPERWKGMKIMVGSKQLYTVGSPGAGMVFVDSWLMLRRSMISLDCGPKGWGSRSRWP